MKYTTLNQIKEYLPCAVGWKKLLSSLNKTKSDNEPLSFIQILESNGIEDAVWCLRILSCKDQAMFMAEVAELVLPLFETQFPDDKRPRKAIKVLKKYAQGKSSLKELKTAADAAYYAANDVVLATSAASASANYAAFAAASAAATATAGAAATSAATAAAATSAAYYAANNVALATSAASAAATADFWNLKITPLFKKHFC